MSHSRRNGTPVKSRLAAGLFFFLALSAAHPSLRAQGSLWVVTTPLGDERLDPRDIVIRADRITLNDHKPPLDVPLEDVLELSVFRPSTFWDGAKDGGLIGAGIGAVGGLAAGVVWSSSSRRQCRADHSAQRGHGRRRFRHRGRTDRRLRTLALLGRNARPSRDER
ncbi:MAG: hypothetical protein IPP94_03445 [Ignavibacteria bacterium]|nr:hypothetical protein [Ignavibacteria bacterium]